MGEFHGRCKRELYLARDNGGCGRTSESWGLGRVGQRKTSLFPEHFTPFPPAGACCRPLKGRIRVRRLPPRSLSRCPPVPGSPPHLPPPPPPIPFSRPVPFSQSTRQFLAALSFENLTLENFPLAEDFHKFPCFYVATSGEGSKDNVVLNYFIILIIWGKYRYFQFY